MEQRGRGVPVLGEGLTHRIGWARLKKSNPLQLTGNNTQKHNTLTA